MIFVEREVQIMTLKDPGCGVQGQMLGKAREWEYAKERRQGAGHKVKEKV